MSAIEAIEALEPVGDHTKALVLRLQCERDQWKALADRMVSALAAIDEGFRLRVMDEALEDYRKLKG